MFGRLAAALFGALWIGMAYAALPVEDFFRPAHYGDAALSPDGKQLAIATREAGGRGGVLLVNVEDPSKSQILGQGEDITVANIAWVNDHRLIYTVIRGAIGQQYDLMGSVFAADTDGGKVRKLISNNTGSASEFVGQLDRILDWRWNVLRTLRDGSDDIIVQGALFDGSGQFREMRLGRLDTRNGLLTSLSAHAPEHATNWWVNAAGGIQAVRAIDHEVERIFVPRGESGGEDWHAIASGNAYTGRGMRFTALGEGVAGKLWVVGSDPERKVDTTVLAELDLAHPEAAPHVILSLPGFDFQGHPIVDSVQHRLLGVAYENDAHGTLWLDDGMRSLQAEIDKKLPATVNQILCTNCLNAPALLVRAESDRQAPVWLRFDRATHALTLLLRSRDWLDPRQMGRRDFLRFKARDGLQIPVMVTHPPGPAQPKRPAVVLVHGGPWARGTHWADWGWHAEAQFLASRGYVVIEPEFRGSTGYGGKLFAAGFKQWGLAMQDDVSDAMDFAVAQGWVDPLRVCIGGASYGGYATLMGLAKETERYRCGFEWVGVSDIELMYSISWSDASEAWKTYGMPQLVGDRVRDAEQLKATSPIALANRIRQPLLLAYGGQDRRVPLKHGEAFRDAVKVHNAQVEWVVYDNEGHGWQALPTNVDFWSRVERLLARTIGDPAPDSRH